MDFHIDPNFSVYRLVGRAHSTAGLHHRQTMNIISNAIEDSTLTDGAQTRIFAAFQRFSRFIPQMARYREIARRAESVYVFGIPDVELPAIDNITYVPLKPTDQLAREWFMVSYGPEYASALATEEQTDLEKTRDTDRLFNGIWTFDPSLTHILEEWLSRTVDAKPLGVPEDSIDRQRHGLLISRLSSRIMRRLSAPTHLGKDAMVRVELRGLVKDVLQPLVSESLTAQLA
jgi:DICT domain-containing protein